MSEISDFGLPKDEFRGFQLQTDVLPSRLVLDGVRCIDDDVIKIHETLILGLHVFRDISQSITGTLLDCW